jgi:adenylate kinase
VIQIFHLKIVDTGLATERLRARALRENRLDDMSEDVIHKRLQTYYDETFKTLSFFPSDLIFDVDAGRRAIDVLCDIVNRLATINKA